MNKPSLFYSKIYFWGLFWVKPIQKKPFAKIKPQIKVALKNRKNTPEHNLVSIKVVKIIHCAGRTHEENHHFVCWAFLDIWHCCWFWSSLWNRMWIVKFLILIWWLEVGLRYKYMCLAHSTWDSFLWFYGCYTLQSNDFWVEKHLVKSTGGHFYSKRWKNFKIILDALLMIFLSNFQKITFLIPAAFQFEKKICKVLPNNDQIV